jgi:ribosomal 30S subunit maturation factor RimM
MGPGGLALGRVVGVIESPGHATLAIAREGRSAVLEVPLVEAWVEHVDLDHRRIVLRSVEDLPDWEAFRG